MLCQREGVCATSPKILLLQNCREEDENEGTVATIPFTIFYANKLYRLDMAEERKLQADLKVFGST